MSVSEDAIATEDFSLAPGLSLIFDLDGVLVDSMPLHTLAWQRYLESAGIPPDHLEARMHGRRNDEIVRDFFGAHTDPLAVFEHGAAKERLFREMMLPHLREHLVPGAAAFLARARNAPIALATNGEPANVNFVLDGAGLRPYFRAVVDGTQVRHPKPAPDVYLRAAELLATEPRNCIVFEDSPVGIQAARDAGARVVGILTHATSLDRVELAIPDFLSTELPRWLAGQKAF